MGNETKKIIFTTESECIHWLQEIKTVVLGYRLKNESDKKHELTDKFLSQKVSMFHV